MLASMTGFGTATVENDDYRLYVELKALNSKFLEFNVKLPKKLSAFEMAFRKALQNKLQRGKFNVLATLEFKKADFQKMQFNAALADAYLADLQNFCMEKRLPHNQLLSEVLKMPEVWKPAEDALTEDLLENFIQTGLAAAEELNQYRLKEGAALEKALQAYVDDIQENLTAVEAVKEERIALVKNKLKEKLEKLEVKNYDEGRFEQELVYYIEKFDITEEIVRLKQHLSYFKESLQETQCGKKLSFVSQEMGREINTMGSKANDYHIQQEVVRMKEALEKIKEQVLNVV